MGTKMIWGNFSVKDVNRTSQFYTELGFKPNESHSAPGLASFLFGDTKFVIHFFEHGSQIDEYLPPGSKNTGEIMFTLSAEKEEEVKELENKVKAAGGEIIQKAGRDKSGYYGFVFADPDGHKFNVLLMEGGM